MTINIMFAGVGGQGLILMTSIVSNAAMLKGYDVKSNDVVGLSQRGGMVWGNVRIGEKIYSPNIPYGEGDILVAMEALEAFRWSTHLKSSGSIIVNTVEMYPTIVQQEKDGYPNEEIKSLSNRYKVIEINALEEAKKLGKKEVANIIMLGLLAKSLDIEETYWQKAIIEGVPTKYIDLNMEAFRLGLHCSQ